MAFYKTLDASTEFSTKLIQQLISEHKEHIEAYKELKDFYTGNHAILKQKAKDKYKPDNRLVVNFAKYIVDTFNGYFIGNPVSMFHENKAVNDYLAYVDGYNDQADNNAELSKICSIYGHGFELVFNDENSEVGITYMTPIDGFVVYDNTIQNKPLFACHYGLNDDDEEVGYFYTKEAVYQFATVSGAYTIVEETPNVFGDIPMIEYLENEERQSIFENVKTLINAFNKALSEKANDVEYYADAYLKVLGAEIDEKTLQTLRDTRIINVSGDDTLTVEFMTKPSADGTQENLLERLQKLIFEISMVANISDENFGDSSGISLRYKLQSMDNLAKSKERKFQSGMSRRYRLISNYPTSKIGENEWVNIQYKFTRNVPANLAEEADIAQTLSGIVSEETQVSVLSIVQNAKEEVQRKNEEMETTDAFTRTAEE
ncbi:phage portal protein [uncultured Streptococcus sp.]|uniref:phage portal protein n=1 Tax=uncultured Streptococcus sp. TaxID=83427 RepID=UPI0025CC18FF|nr:phage portal protein [uncultured Streptococcus sp.]